MTHTSVEVELFALHPSPLLCDTHALSIVKPHPYSQECQEDSQGDGENDDKALYVYEFQVFGCFLLQLFQLFRLPHHLVALQEEHVGVVACDKSGGEHRLPLIRLPFEDFQSQLQQVVSPRRVDVAGIEQRVANQTDAAVLTGKAVDATEHWQGQVPLHKRLASADGRAVVVAEDEVDVAQGVQTILHSVVCRAFRPVALKCGHHLHLGEVGDGVAKAFVALVGR